MPGWSQSAGKGSPFSLARKEGPGARRDGPPGAAGALREYLHGDYLMLYTVVDTPPDALPSVYLLSIRHHRQLSFDFARLWPARAP